MTPTLFSELGLSPELLKAIDKLGFEQAAPIQAASIPILMSGRDLVGQSQTGSGKTAAFAIPAIEKADPNIRAVQTLILCPTRELAVQVSEEVHKLALFKRGLHALPIYGGQSYERQFSGLKQGVQIVIGTPGRVMDHMRRGTLQLSQTKMVVLDEADVMLDMGFRDDIEIILQGVPAERQTVFFSATMPRTIQELIKKYARNPETVRLDQKILTVPTVEQIYYEVDRRFKVELLTRLIDIHDLKLGIVFCNTKRMVDDLVDHLNAQGYSADRLHGDMNQGMRDRVMTKFRRSGLEFLVATDVAARGIDVDDVQVVFNYDLPYDAEDYVHRIGRTGRAGKSGRAISFASGREVFQIRNIERFTNFRMTRGKVPTVDEVEEARADVFLEKVRITLRGGEFKKQEHLVERLLEEGFVSTDIASALLHHLQNGAAPTAGAPARAEAAPSREEARSAPQRRDPVGRPPMTRVSPSRAVEPKPSNFRADAPPAREKPIARSQESTPDKPVELAQDEAERHDRKHNRLQAPPVAFRPPMPSRPPEKRPVAARTEESRPLKRPVTTAPGAVRKVPPTPAEQVRLHINVGAEMEVGPGDVVGAIMGETGLPAKTVGTIEIRERHLFVDVTKEHANSIIAKLSRTRIKGQKLKVKIA